MSIAELVDTLLRFYGLLIFVYVILSWFRPSGFVFDIYRTLGTIVEPYVGLFRRILPTAGAGGVGVDFSPFVAYLVLDFVIRKLVFEILSRAGL